MKIEKGDLRLVAQRPLSCAGNGDQYHRERHGYCGIAIVEGQEFIERNPEPDKYGSAHCLKCYELFFSH